MTSPSDDNGRAMVEDTKTLLLFLLYAESTEVSAGEIMRGTDLSCERLRAALDPKLVEMVEWCSSYVLVRYVLTPAGRRAALGLGTWKKF